MIYNLIWVSLKKEKRFNKTFFIFLKAKKVFSLTFSFILLRFDQSLRVGLLCLLSFLFFEGNKVGFLKGLWSLSQAWASQITMVLVISFLNLRSRLIILLFVWVFKQYLLWSVRLRRANDIPLALEVYQNLHQVCCVCL